MYFITTKRMLEVCFFQHTPTFIIEPDFTGLFLYTNCIKSVDTLGKNKQAEIFLPQGPEIRSVSRRESGKEEAYDPVRLQRPAADL